MVPRIDQRVVSVGSAIPWWCPMPSGKWPLQKEREAMQNLASSALDPMNCTVECAEVGDQIQNAERWLRQLACNFDRNSPLNAGYEY